MAINYTKTNWVNGQAPAISANNLNKIEQGIKDACDGVDELKPPTGSFIEQKTLLWENASETSAFAGQTVSLDLSGYDHVEISYRWQTSASLDITVERIKVNEKTMAQFYYDSSNAAIRYATKRSDGVFFESARKVSGTADNNMLIPRKIWGVKEV